MLTDYLTSDCIWRRQTEHVDGIVAMAVNDSVTVAVTSGRIAWALWDVKDGACFGRVDLYVPSSCWCLSPDARTVVGTQVCDVSGMSDLVANPHLQF